MPNGNSVIAAVLALLALPGSVSASVVIGNVQIVDATAATVGAPRDVEIDGDRIVAIRVPAAAGAAAVKRLDATGRYLVPGYADMHVHVNDRELAEGWMLPLLLSAGITTVRDMAGDCWTPGCGDNITFMRGLRERIARGEVLGPRIVAIASGLVHGPRKRQPEMPLWSAPAHAQQAQRLVTELQRRGVDLIKPYDTMPRAAYFAMVERARAVGLTVGGHVPMSVSLREAVRAGQHSIEHAKHPAIDCGRFSRTFHEVFAAWAAGDSQRIYANWAGDVPANNLGGYYRHILATYDPALCKAVIAGFAASGAYYVPTLVTRRFEALADETAFTEDSRLASVPRGVRSSWAADSNNYRRRFADRDEKRAYVDLYELAVRLVGDAHRAGVPILVGTDTPDSYCFPGAGYHDELQQLARAGLSNAAILRAATSEAARFMGIEQHAGTIKVGAVADLVVLEGNPLEDIGNAGQIAAVVANGRVLDRAALDALAKQAAGFSGPQPSE
jgi:imidazolonepropionase-like amidohydrolase